MFWGRFVCSNNRYEACSKRKKLCNWITIVYKCCCCDKFSSKIRDVPWSNNRLLWSSIKSSFQRIKNRQIWTTMWRVMEKSFNAARSEISRDKAYRRGKTSITSSYGVQLEQMNTCWKDNLIHIARSLDFGICSEQDEGVIQWERGSNKQPRRWWQCQRMTRKHCAQASSNPDTLGKARTMRRHIIGPMQLAGDQWWWPWSLGMHNMTL